MAEEWTFEEFFGFSPNMGSGKIEKTIMFTMITNIVSPHSGLKKDLLDVEEKYANLPVGTQLSMEEMRDDNRRAAELISKIQEIENSFKEAIRLAREAGYSIEHDNIGFYKKSNHVKN